MSVYGYLSCHDCRQIHWLGKAVRPQQGSLYFHRGGPRDPPHWRRETLNQVIWKFLADHVAHRIDVRLDHDMTEEIHGYQEIGGDSDADVTIDEYLDGWHGLSE